MAAGGGILMVCGRAGCYIAQVPDPVEIGIAPETA